MAKFGGPIPGQSLTRTPGNYAWERPPEITDPEMALQFHLMRLSDDDRMNTVLDALEFGVTDLYTLVKGMMRGAVANGIHTIEVGMICAPVVHEYIKQTADAMKIEYDDGINEGSRKEQEQKARAAMKAQKMLEKMGIEPEPIERESNMPQEPAAEMTEEMPMEEPAPQKGLMAREVM